MLAKELRAIRPDVQIVVVESDAISTYKSHRSCDETFQRLGYLEIARQNDIELLNLSKTDSIEIAFEGIPAPILVSELFLEEFFFISIANLKVHAYEYMTGILKNSIGLLTGSDLTPFHQNLPLLISVGCIGSVHLTCASWMAASVSRATGRSLGIPYR